MKRNDTREIEGIGPVHFDQSNKAKYLRITIKPIKGIRVTVPRGVSFDSAEKFVRSKILWIQKNLDRIKQLEAEFRSARKTRPKIEKSNAREIIIKRLDELSCRHDLSFNKVAIRNQKTRWGSCSSKNNINLNFKLVDLPKELMDYVILHELVHTKVKNHGRQFLLELNKYVGDAKVLSKKLKKYGMLLV